MKTKKINAGEGTLVAVPLKEGGYAIGLVARKNKKAMLGYFFAKTYPEAPSFVEPPDLDKKEVILIAKFSSLNIESGEWPIVKNPIIFEKDEWSIPVFKMQDPLTNRYYAVIYEEDLLHASRHLITGEDAEKLYSDGAYGSVALEMKLSDLLKPGVV